MLSCSHFARGEPWQLADSPWREYSRATAPTAIVNRNIIIYYIIMNFFIIYTKIHNKKDFTL